jgi:hypothetical protein
MMWCSLESVFLSGDIAKQMPADAKKFAKIDKDWQKIMANASTVGNVVEASANEVLRASLPSMYGELEKCQKSLEGYLEQKRNKFPRFFFVSNPGLLMILSQGSDPLSMNEHYEKVFDAIENVDHSKKDKTIIEVRAGERHVDRERGVLILREACAYRLVLCVLCVCPLCVCSVCICALCSFCLPACLTPLSLSLCVMAFLGDER